MRLRLQSRLTLLSVASIALMGAAMSLLGVQLIDRMVRREAQARVAQDLRSASERIHGRAQEVRWILTTAGQRCNVAEAIQAGDLQSLRARLRLVQDDAGLDFVGVTDQTGRVLLRTATGSAIGDELAADPLIRSALGGEPVIGFQVLDRERLAGEGGELPLQAYVPFRDTPRAKPRPDDALNSGLVLAAAVPIHGRRGEPIGAIYGGTLMSRNYGLLDGIYETLAGGEEQPGAIGPTVTIFQWDVRVATNVRDQEGHRAIGTRVSAEVYDQVLENGRSWYGRAFVVRDWFITAYEPIRDVTGKIVGILYVGAPEQRFRQMKRELVASFLALAVLGVVVTAFLAGLIRHRIITPLRRLAEASRRVQRGDFDIQVPVRHGVAEVTELTSAFNAMVEALHSREEELRVANANLRSSNEELAGLNRNYMGVLGFVAHEMKNPLAGSVMALMTLERKAEGKLDERGLKMLASVRRTLTNAGELARNYLNLARLERGEITMQAEDVNVTADILLPLLDELGEEIAERKLLLRNKVPPSTRVRADPGLAPIVFQNLVRNAVAYARPGGAIALRVSHAGPRLRFEVWNEGDGVTPEEASRLFEKFFRGEAGERLSRRGTGLGLYICKTIVEAHGGRIEVQSAPGEWINFIFTLPREPNA